MVAVVPRAAVVTQHYLRVPVVSAQGMDTVAAWLAGHGVPVQQVALAAPTTGHAADTCQVLVLTGAVNQATVDSAVQALQAHADVAGQAVTLRVELLA